MKHPDSRAPLSPPSSAVCARANLHLTFLSTLRYPRRTGRKSPPGLSAQRASPSKWSTPPRARGSIYATPCGTPETPDTRHDPGGLYRSSVTSHQPRLKPSLLDRQCEGVIPKCRVAFECECVSSRSEHCGMTPTKLAGGITPLTGCTSSTDPRPVSSGTNGSVRWSKTHSVHLGLVHILSFFFFTNTTEDHLGVK